MYKNFQENQDSDWRIKQPEEIKKCFVDEKNTIYDICALNKIAFEPQIVDYDPNKLTLFRVSFVSNQPSHSKHKELSNEKTPFQDLYQISF
jgi:hypothetical protein